MDSNIDSITSACSAWTSMPSCRPRVSPYAMKLNRVIGADAASAGNATAGASVGLTVVVSRMGACAATKAGTISVRANRPAIRVIEFQRLQG